MNVSLWVWLLTVGVLITVLAVDIFIIARRPHEPSMLESATWVGGYVAFAIAFGIGVTSFAGGEIGKAFFAGYITEYSLSIDNLFIFVLILSRFAVPREYQQTALMVGIILAIVMRGFFIAIGATAVSLFSWVFYIFGVFLIFTAIQLIRHSQDHGDGGDNAILRFARRHLSTTEQYHGMKMTIVENGKRLVTPMLLVIIALGTTDVIFALDSIPAIYGLTKEPYLVFTANVFALMGLRQLYFLLGGLLKRLIYLTYGLSVILGFIGVKLILDALHENRLSFINGGRPVEELPLIGSTHIDITPSLVFIVGVLIITTVASLLVSARRERARARTE